MLTDRNTVEFNTPFYIRMFNFAVETKTKVDVLILFYVLNLNVLKYVLKLRAIEF